MLVKIISTMLQNTYTTDDLVLRIGLMRAYFGKRLFAGGEDTVLRTVLANECDEDTLAALEAWVHAFQVSDLSPLVVYEALDAIEEDLAGIPALTLYVPVLFEHTHIERFGTWFRAHLQPNMLLTVRVDPYVVGGCAFVWHDVYYDFSFRYYVEREQQKVFAMFDRHLHVK